MRAVTVAGCTSRATAVRKPPHYESTAILWLAVAAALLLVLSWRPVEFRWLPLTLAAGLEAEMIVSVVYRQSF